MLVLELKASNYIKILNSQTGEEIDICLNKKYHRNQKNSVSICINANKKYKISRANQTYKNSNGY